MNLDHNSLAAMVAYARYRDAKRAESRRETCFYFGMPLAVICLSGSGVAAALLAFGRDYWWFMASMLVGLLVARQMMAPGVNHDGLGYRIRPTCRRILLLLCLRRC
jgi:hypothetical protein